ncbi:hypothetical protein ACQEVR_21610 [Actinomadura nitritigenes]
MRVGGTGGLALRATAALDPARADLIVVPGASGRIGDPGETPGHAADPSEPHPDDTIPDLLGRTLTTGLPPSSRPRWTTRT